MTPASASWRARLVTSPAWRVFLWCLPALVLGAVLRAVLCLRMPSAFYHPDSEQVFATWHYLLQGSLQIHEKKTPLGPLLYCLPPLLHVPVLPAIALAQHMLGLSIVAMAGCLLAKSFTHWRLFIIPVTVALAINPVLLWYEHTALPETCYVFSIAATGLTALAYVRHPATLRLLAFGAALFLTAGFRPEGKLFCLFGLAVGVLVSWGHWRRARLALPFLALLTILCFALNQTHQSGSLLYSNVAHLTPAHLHSAPGFAEEHQEYFAALRGRWGVTPTSKIARERKQIISYLREYTSRHRLRGVSVNQLCSRIGAEVCARNLLALPELTLLKFRFALRNPTAEDFGPDWVYRRQTEAFAGDNEDPDSLAIHGSEAASLARIALGREFSSRAELESYLRRTCHPFSPDWLTAYEVRYAEAETAFRLPDNLIDGKPLPGLPWLYLLAGLGLLSLAIRDRRLRGFYLLWFGMLLGMLVVLTLTGSNLGRFRLGFEPFWLLYACAVFDVLLTARKTGKPSSPESGALNHRATHPPAARLG